MSPAVIAAAQRLSGGSARPAVEFLDYEQRMAPAVLYAFGNVFICQVRLQVSPRWVDDVHNLDRDGTQPSLHLMASSAACVSRPWDFSFPWHL